MLDVQTALESILIDFLSFTNPLYGLYGAFLSGMISWKIERSSLRWSLCFALVAALISIVGRFHTDARVFPEMPQFVASFIVIGALAGFLASRYANGERTLWVLGYTILGGGAAAISQIRHESLVLLPIGAGAGAFIWIVSKPRLRWGVAFAGIGALSGWSLLGAPFTSTSTILLMLGSSLVAGLIGWLILNERLRWMFAISITTGTLATFFENPALFDWSATLWWAIVGAVVGWMISKVRLRGVITFIIFGSAGTWTSFTMWEVAKDVQQILHLG